MNSIQANQFCNSTTHDYTATNQQNFWCRNRSVKTIINNHPDVKGKPALSSNTNTVPTFVFLQPTPQPVYIVLDSSSHMTGSDYDTVFNTVKDKLDGFLATGSDTLSNARPTSMVSILTMGGPRVPSTSTNLGGYLTIVQDPLSVIILRFHSNNDFPNSIQLYIRLPITQLPCGQK